MGGGGGGFRGLSSGEKERLENVAKESLAKAGASGKCNVFLSFANEDLNKINLLRGQAKNENSDIEFNDWSLQEPFDSKNAEYIKRGIRERIRQSSVTVVFISEHTAQSRWVDWEIRESRAMGKGVVAMYSGSAPPTNMPSAVSELKVQVVPWNQKELSKAIKREANNR